VEADLDLAPEARATFAGSRFRLKLSSDFSGGIFDFRSNRPIRFWRRSWHSRVTNSSRYRS